MLFLQLIFIIVVINVNKPLYKENLTKKDKLEKWGTFVFLIIMCSIVIFGYHWMFREYTNNPEEAGGIEIIIVYGIITFILLVYFYKKKFSPVFYKEIIEIYEDKLIINRTISKKIFDKGDIDKMYMINWNLPPFIQSFNPSKRVKGFAVELKDGDHYYTKEKPKHILSKILNEIEEHWGENYVGENKSKEMT